MQTSCKLNDSTSVVISFLFFFHFLVFVKGKKFSKYGSTKILVLLWTSFSQNFVRSTKILVQVWTSFWQNMCQLIPLHSCDYLLKTSIKIGVVTDEGKKPKWNVALNKWWNWSSCTKLAVSASWTDGLIVG